MKLVPNSGADCVIDLVRPHLHVGTPSGCGIPSLSLFADAELRDAQVAAEQVVPGSFAVSTDGLDLTPSKSLNQRSARDLGLRTVSKTLTLRKFQFRTGSPVPEAGISWRVM